MINAGINVEGLKEFRRDLKKIDPELVKELRTELLSIATEIALETRQRVPTGPTGRARASVRAGVSGNNAYVAGGKASVPYYGWLDFGGRTPVTGNPRSVGPWKGSGPGPRSGRYIYPTIVRNKRDIEQKAQQAFDKAADSALKKSYE